MMRSFARRSPASLLFGVIFVMASYGPGLSWSQDAAPPAASTAKTANANADVPAAATGSEEGKKPADAAVKAALPPPRPPFILDPYQIRVRVTWPGTSLFPADRVAQLSQAVELELQTRFRQMWTLDCATTLPTERQTYADLRGADIAEWTERYSEHEVDKVIHAVVENNGTLYTVSALEWCNNSRSLSPLVLLETADTRNLAGIVADTVALAFRPIGELEVSEGEKLEFQIRAGEFPPQDAAMDPFQVGQYLVPYMRYLGKKRELMNIQPIPWTYLRVVERDRSRVRVDVISAFKQPITGARRRVEVMAMLLRPSWDESDILIYPRGGKRTPLVGYHCDVVDRIPTLEDPVLERDVYYTSRRGTITVPVPPGDPLRYLIVHSGQSVLAKLPFIPGTYPRLEVEVPDDRARLSVEGEVSLLQGELIDIVATREVMMARARAAAKKQDWTSVDKFTQQVTELPDIKEFQGRVETLQLQAVYKAQLAKDRAAESRIKKLCGQVLESAEKHLDPSRIAEFRGEIRANRNE